MGCTRDADAGQKVADSTSRVLLRRGPDNPFERRAILAQHCGQRDRIALFIQGMARKNMTAGHTAASIAAQNSAPVYSAIGESDAATINRRVAAAISLKAMAARSETCAKLKNPCGKLS